MKADTITGCPRSRGKAELLRHMAGHKLTLRRAVYAKCFECMGGYIDGKVDCRIVDCPLYPWMPYKIDSTAANTPKQALPAT